MDIYAAFGQTLLLVVADGLFAVHIDKLFNAAHPEATVQIFNNLIHVGDARDLIKFPFTEAVKPAGVFLHESTNPEGALPILMNGSHVRSSNLEITHHSRAVAM